MYIILWKYSDINNFRDYFVCTFICERRQLRKVNIINVVFVGGK